MQIYYNVSTIKFLSWLIYEFQIGINITYICVQYCTIIKVLIYGMNTIFLNQ